MLEITFISGCSARNGSAERVRARAVELAEVCG